MLAVPALAFWAAALGVDFGYHWDEHLLLRSISQSIATGIPLPGTYRYPSLYFAIGLLSLIPDILRYHLSRHPPELGGQYFLWLTSQSPEFHLRLRLIFIAISALTPAWVYVLARSLKRGRAEALLASALVGFSWEAGYHMRWLATDALLMQFSALTLMVLFQERSRPARESLLAAAAAAGLAWGTKYQGVMLVLPVLLSAALDEKGRLRRPPPWRLFGGILGVSCLAYLLTTPGTLLAPADFLRGVGIPFGSSGLYNKLGFGGYTVAPGPEHLLRMAAYFALAVSSRHELVSLFFFLMAGLGARALWREQRREALVLLCFPAAYLGLVSCLKMMIVRNLLAVFPFFALLSARGCAWVQERFLGGTRRAWIFPALVAGLCLLDAAGIFSAALSVRNRGRTDYAAQLAGYIDARPRTRFLVSERVAAELRKGPRAERPNASLSLPAGADEAVFYASEVTRVPDHWKLWRANRPHYATRWFGPDEVNFNYYPSWDGDDRIVVMPLESALPLEVFRGRAP